MISDNIIHIPAYLETHALAFAGTYIIRGEDHIRRVIINDENIVHVNDDRIELADFKAIDMSVSDWTDMDWNDDDPAIAESYPNLLSVYNLYADLKSKISYLDNTGTNKVAAGKILTTTSTGTEWKDLTVDNSLIEGSTNPVSGGAVEAAMTNLNESLGKLIEKLVEKGILTETDLS